MGRDTIKASLQRDRTSFRQMLKHVAVLLGYDTKKRSYPRHSFHRLSRQTGGADWLGEEWNEEVDVAKVMMAFEYGCLSAANRGKEELGERTW
jgi:hypothetical protein